jgi:glycosyltransferase involved in cell wall biosynthesis
VLNLPLWLPGAFELRTLSFARAARHFLACEEEAAIVYTRGEMALFLASLPARFTLAWETHMLPARPARYQRAAERANAIVAITKHYAAEIPKVWRVKSDKVLYAPDGVSLAPFAHLPSRAEARRTLGLPLEKKIALYAGSDLPWKGLHLLREASELLPEDVLTVFVGTIKEVGAASPRRMFVAPQPYTKIPLWLAAADVLVLTGDPSSETARHYTSPLKLFEYMAAERPVVATDLPATRDILDDTTAYLAEPSASALAQAIEAALTHPEEASARAARARALVERYTWSERARAIAHLISL